MRALMLVNWKVHYCEKTPVEWQPPDYFEFGKPYWFFRYFEKQIEVDVIDIHSLPIIERFEKNKLRFYVIQTLRILPVLRKYDVIISHGMQSAVLLSFWRRFFKTDAKHIVFDIGSFSSASKSGVSLKLMQFASRSIDGVIYHTSSQIEYYKSFFPWIVSKARFIRFGADLEFFAPREPQRYCDKNAYIICVGYTKRDWDTVVNAYSKIDTNVQLKLVGHVEEKYNGIKGIVQIPYVPITELIDQILNSEFCILPLESFNYSFGQMTLMQQMALGKCVVAAKVPSLIDYLCDGQNAILYEPKNELDCEKKIRSVLENEKLRRQIESGTREYLKVHCNEKIMAKEVEKFIYDICGQS
ncbi:glycosyltransferase family 4 protein [Lacrimispora sp. NSJ-141]|uniref:Glycosyltransferase family 4 protein n=1 Tax=Lientehia hominis TaxID=2897778 RepID=A0AAP2RK85_9FIRM|nr:glycosyltransferase family 4 protein [Lientehia hominis]MCD2492278.1 glycosyltransferase family 4 protein [Lientehia hominis]